MEHAGRTMPRARISFMTQDDVDEVLQVEGESHMEPWSRGSFLEELENPHSRVLVARLFEGVAREPSVGGMFESPEKGSWPAACVAGYICFWMVADEVQILNITVSPSYRQRGLGRALMLCALGWALGSGDFRIAVLEARKSNNAALHLYATLGFQQVGLRPDYYGGQREPAILMELSLDDRWVSLHHDEMETLNCKGMLP